MSVSLRACGLTLSLPYSVWSLSERWFVWSCLDADGFPTLLSCLTLSSESWICLCFIHSSYLLNNSTICATPIIASLFWPLELEGWFWNCKFWEKKKKKWGDISWEKVWKSVRRGEHNTAACFNNLQHIDQKLIIIIHLLLPECYWPETFQYSLT